MVTQSSRGIINGGFAIGFILMMGQALYIDYKLNKNFQNQMNRLKVQENRLEDIQKRLEVCKNRILK